MASHEFPESDGSGDESDGHIFHARLDPEVRLRKLGSNIPIPSQSDILESDDPEEDLYNHAPEVLPEVAFINSKIMSNGNRLLMPEPTPSSVPGKLKRPSLDHTHRDPSPALPEDIYDIATLPEPVVHPSSSLLRKNPSNKPKKSSLPSHPQRKIVTAPRTDMLEIDASSDHVVEPHSTMDRVQQTYGPQQPFEKRRRLDDAITEARGLRNSSTPEASASDRTLRNGELPNSPAPNLTSGRVTRSSKLPVTPRFDLSQPICRQHRGKNRSIPMTQDQPFIPKTDSSPALDKQQPYPKSPRQGYPRSRQVVEVVVNIPASIQLPSKSTDTAKQPTSPPAIVQGSPIMKTSPVSPADVVQDHCRDRMSSDHPADSVSPVVDIKDIQSPVAEEGQGSTREDTALFEPCTQPTRDERSQTEMLEADFTRIQELHETYPEDDSEDDFAGSENCDDETNSCENISMPEELDEALKKAHEIHGQAESVRQRFDGIRILKSYNTLKKNVLRWKAAQNYRESDRLIQLSQKTRKEAKAIFQKSVWDQNLGLDYVYKRVLPTLVRMFYVTLVYYLSEVGTIERLSFRPLKESRSVIAAILHIFDQAKNAETQYTRPRDVISMIARIKKVIKVFDRRFRALEMAKSEAEAIQRQQTQRSRQETVDREKEDELKLKEWRHRWNVLHDQRLGAAMEGRTFLSGEQGRHLRQIPLDNPYVAPSRWDNTDSFYLVEGLKKFKGPNVYREIFRKYCRHGGPLQQFNVAEIVDKAVTLKATLTKLAADDGEELDQWVKDIFDPRVPPEGLCRVERRYQD